MSSVLGRLTLGRDGLAQVGAGATEQTSSFAADAWIKTDFTVDAFVQPYFQVDAYLSLQQTGSFGADAFVQPYFRVDARVVGGTEFPLDAFVQPYFRASSWIVDGTAQVSHPVSDVATGGWTPTPLWSRVDDGDGSSVTDTAV